MDGYSLEAQPGNMLRFFLDKNILLTRFYYNLSMKVFMGT
jgi:hypothetical protein